MSKTCFINCGIGEWYSKGSERLKASLLQHNFPGDVYIWKHWPERYFDKRSIYNCKPAAFLQVMDAGYTTIIWGDSSITATGPMQPFVDEINRKGYWLGQSGYNCAQVCPDRMLQYFGESRDWAEKIPDCATGLFGVNLETRPAADFINLWVKAAEMGVFKGSRGHEHQSRDPRFLFGRQDQAAASVIAGKLGMKLDEFGKRVTFKWDSNTGQEFHCEGM